jgi:spoIIIJ-associated protein
VAAAPAGPAEAAAAVAAEAEVAAPGTLAAPGKQATGPAEPTAVETTAQEVLERLLKEIGVPGQVTVHMVAESAEAEEGPMLRLDIAGPDLGLLIGRRGETLAALQYLTRIMVSRRAGQWLPVVVDVEGYKQRRERSLRELAQRMAQRVQDEGRPVTLEPMPPHERRIVHLALREHQAVTTLSVGEGDSRKVTIRPKR